MAEVGGDILPPTPRGYPGPIAWLGLTVEPTTHTEWIGTRARAQFDAGLIEEAQALRERFDPGLPAFSAIGYREAWAVLDGLLTREAAIELDAKRNLAFARRQRTWFRSEPGITWLDATHKLPTAAGLALVRDVFQGQNGGIRMSDEPTVLFVCRHGAAKSVLAAAGLRRLAAGRGLRIVVDSAGIEPDAAVSPAVADALRRDGVDLAGLHPRLVRAAELTSAARVITFDLEPTELPIAAVDVERWDDVPPVGDAPDRAQAVIARHLEVLVDREFRSTPED
jgi:protein-tyrosine-phosphatase